jgi:hypothetical protein
MKNERVVSLGLFFTSRRIWHTACLPDVRGRVLPNDLREISLFSLFGGVAMRCGLNVFLGAVAAVAVTAGSVVDVNAQTVGLYELARFNLNATSNSSSTAFIGSNPYSVAWNGSKLYVAGVNNSGAAGTTAIVEVTNAADVTSGTLSGIVTPTYSPAFGQLTAGTSSLGYRGLALNDGLLAAAWDSGANSANSYQLFDATANTLNWNMSVSGINIRGWAVAFDPGYQGNPAQGGGFAFVNTGSGRRQLNNVATGANIYNSSNGFFLNNSAGQSTWRDMAFDPATGDVYMKATNLVTKTVRTGANATYPNSASPETTILVNQATTTNIGSTVAFMSAITASAVNPYAGDLVVYNSTAAPLASNWTDAIKFVSTSGSSVAAEWTFISAPPTSVSSIYDFAWDPGTQTLAVLDYTNRNVSVFTTAVPEPTTWALLGTGAIAAAVAMVRRRSKPTRL